MGGSIECFLITPSPYAEESLRRFTFSTEGHCPVTDSSGHNARLITGIIDYPLDVGDDGTSTMHYPQDDLRWPLICPCGYAFKETDEWQHNINRLYWREGDLQSRIVLSHAPPGSMYFADWYNWYGPDGRCLVVVTPGGPWVVDGPSRNNDGSRGNPWTRTGVVPKVTANPSIHIPGKYHGFLRNGFLEEC